MLKVTSDTKLKVMHGLGFFERNGHSAPPSSKPPLLPKPDLKVRPRSYVPKVNCYLEIVALSPSASAKAEPSVAK